MNFRGDVLAAPGTGLLAADESTGTIGKRFDAIGLENSETNRRAYRTLLATAAGLSESISGVILYEETLFQTSSAEAGGAPIVDLFQQQGIVPGIKVDLGVEPLPGGLEGESWCTGLRGLAERAARYYAQGARFAKWRAVLRISAAGCPSELAVRENAWGLARYARTVQEHGLVPIVEPEILMDGDHDITTTASVQEWVLRTTYEALAINGVFLEGSLLKPSMTCPGAECPQRSSAEEVGEFTVRTLSRTVPAAVPAILFLSGGLSEEEAWKLVTLNPAKALHLEAQMGSVKAGKAADLVLWTANPLSIEARVSMTMVDGVVYYEEKQQTEKQAQNEQERTRILSLMLAANERGEASKTPQKKVKKHFHCDTLGEEATETENSH